MRTRFMMSILGIRDRRAMVQQRLKKCAVLVLDADLDDVFRVLVGNVVWVGMLIISAVTRSRMTHSSSVPRSRQALARMPAAMFAYLLLISMLIEISP